MNPSRHLIVSLAIGIIGFVFIKDILVIFISLAWGFLIDFDHYIEYIANTGFKNALKIRKFLSSEHFVHSDRLIIIFHAYEYLLLFIIAWIITKENIYITYAFYAYTAHLIMDQIGNYDLQPWFYFLTIRIYYRFQRARLVKPAFVFASGDERRIVREELIKAKHTRINTNVELNSANSTD